MLRIRQPVLPCLALSLAPFEHDEPLYRSIALLEPVFEDEEESIKPRQKSFAQAISLHDFNVKKTKSFESCEHTLPRPPLRAPLRPAYLAPTHFLACTSDAALVAHHLRHCGHVIGAQVSEVALEEVDVLNADVEVSRVSPFDFHATADAGCESVEFDIRIFRDSSDSVSFNLGSDSDSDSDVLLVEFHRSCGDAIVFAACVRLAQHHLHALHLIASAPPAPLAPLSAPTPTPTPNPTLPLTPSADEGDKQQKLNGTLLNI